MNKREKEYIDLIHEKNRLERKLKKLLTKEKKHARPTQ